jgi:hypothetical protein
VPANFVQKPSARPLFAVRKGQSLDALRILMSSMMQWRCPSIRGQSCFAGHNRDILLAEPRSWMRNQVWRTGTISD